MEYQVDLSAVHQPILQLTIVISETCASNTIGMNILSVFLQLTCVFLQLTALESTFVP